MLRPGALATVQDLGRPGLGSHGVTRGGAMDPLALRAANALLGNPPGAAVLEVTGPGCELQAEEDGVLALAGADLEAGDVELVPVARQVADVRAHAGVAVGGRALGDLGGDRLEDDVVGRQGGDGIRVAVADGLQQRRDDLPRRGGNRSCRRSSPGG